MAWQGTKEFRLVQSCFPIGSFASQKSATLFELMFNLYTALSVGICQRASKSSVGMKFRILSKPQLETNVIHSFIDIPQCRKLLKVNSTGLATQPQRCGSGSTKFDEYGTGASLETGQ